MQPATTCAPAPNLSRRSAANATNTGLTWARFLLLLLVGLAQRLGYLFVRLGQPQVVGGILAGVVPGPALIGPLHFAAGLMEASHHEGNILNFIYWLGLFLRMFLSEAETRQ